LTHYIFHFGSAITTFNSLAKAHAKEQLLTDLQLYQIGIAIVSETKLKKRHSLDFSRLTGYKGHRRDRLERGGGGVAIYVSEDSNSAALTVTGDTRTLELLWVLVEAPTKSILVGDLYHPQKYSYPVEKMYEFIETSLEELMCQHPDASVVLAGDFNTLNIGEISVRTGLLPLVKTPTAAVEKF